MTSSKSSVTSWYASMAFVIKIYVQWKDWRTGRYGKPDCHLAWPIVDSIKVEEVWSGSDRDFHLNLEMDWADKEKYLGFPSHYRHQNQGIYDGANCRQIISLHDDRNKVMKQLVIKERPGEKYLRKVVKPWIEHVLDYIKPVACIGELD